MLKAKLANHLPYLNFNKYCKTFIWPSEIFWYIIESLLDWPSFEDTGAVASSNLRTRKMAQSGQIICCSITQLLLDWSNPLVLACLLLVCLLVDWQWRLVYLCVVWIMATHIYRLSTCCIPLFPYCPSLNGLFSAYKACAFPPSLCFSRSQAVFPSPSLFFLCMYDIHWKSTGPLADSRCKRRRRRIPWRRFSADSQPPDAKRAHPGQQLSIRSAQGRFGQTIIKLSSWNWTTSCKSPRRHFI